MLSAQKQRMPSDTPPEATQSSAATGFGRVLNSIQGLQQRLDDFSVEEVSRAHAKARNLIRELDELQARLSALAKLKDSVISANAQIAAIPKENFDLVGPDSLDNHPQLRAIVQAGKLIRMNRMLRAVQASVESPYVDPPISEAGEGTLANPPVKVGSVTSSSSNQATETLAKSAGDNDEILSNADQRFAVSQKVSVPNESKATPIYDFAELKLEETRLPVYREDSVQVKPGHTHGPSRKSRKPKGKPQIDQQLLSKVIETYGEFSIPKQLTAPTAATITDPAGVVEVPQISTDLVPVDATRPEPAFLLPAVQEELLGLPAPQKEREEPVFDGPSPTLKSQGEIDRQLKSIIKDYGEYDLYSHQKSINVKAAIIAAAVVLILVIGAIYFFTSTSSSKPTAVGTTSPGTISSQVSDPRSSKQNLK